MIKKKNRFLTFIFSLIPGAGEMYLGFMKEGLSIMVLAMILFMGSTSWFIKELILFLPLIWFYSFFNVNNKVSLSDEEFYALEDHYLFRLDETFPDKNLTKRQKTVFGWVLVLFGTAIIWEPAIRSLLAVLRVYISADFSAIVRNFLYAVPRYAIALILIFCGIRLIRNKKTELYEEPENK